MPKMMFGKYAGYDMEEVPIDYLEYLIRSSGDRILECKAEIERRKLKVENSVMARIVKAGFDSLLTTEPTSEHTRLTAAHSALMKALTDASQPKTP